MSYITTYTRNHFNPVHPEAEKIDIQDIAHALSLTCRGNMGSTHQRILSNTAPESFTMNCCLRLIITLCGIPMQRF